MQALHIGDLVLERPIIQGGMGVGVSRGKLAGAVSACGGLGVISSAQIGYDEPGFATDQWAANKKAIQKHITLAKEISGGKPVGINIMVALQKYEEQVRASVEAGVDAIISGAGLPMRLPEYVGDSGCKIAPIVSSQKAAKIILNNWKKKFNRTADFVVIEGPKAGGHLGFSTEQLETMTTAEYEEEVCNIIATVQEYAKEFNQEIPVILAGGIFDYQDICHAFELGAQGVQIASRFVATEECDASDAYKQAYIQAKAEDVSIVMSPVGMPGRALNNAFIKQVKKEKQKITKCYNCLTKCNPAEVPYCITQALTAAVEGDIDNGLVFVGENVDRINRMTTVKALMDELTNETLLSAEGCA
ncbi:MAG: nitronate monooxygenase [Lachnospiraceae bacterium]|nr:nitronate monooxygenase [Lachnospiraceae bacterium]